MSRKGHISRSSFAPRIHLAPAPGRPPPAGPVHCIHLAAQPLPCQPQSQSGHHPCQVFLEQHTWDRDPPSTHSLQSGSYPPGRLETMGGPPSYSPAMHSTPRGAAPSLEGDSWCHQLLPVHAGGSSLLILTNPVKAPHLPRSWSSEVRVWLSQTEGC